MKTMIAMNIMTLVVGVVLFAIGIWQIKKSDNRLEGLAIALIGILFAGNAAIYLFS